MTKIRKAVIPVAGFGTRFLPATKAQPKEMLPIVDKPIIQYVVEEAVASGITDIILVTGASKRAVEDHFDYNFELQNWLKKQGKDEQLEEVKRIAEMANFIYVRQKGPYGNGTPVLSAKNVVGDEPFVVMWGDEFIYSTPPRAKQCLDVFEKYGDPVISGIRVPKKDVSKYGIAEVTQVEKNIYQIASLVEKPEPDEAPSNLATHGCYVLTPDIFSELEKLKPGKGGEIWLVDAIKALMKKRPVYTCEIENATYYDTGSKIGWLRANVDFALRDKNLSEEFRKYLKSVI
ncbi:MAG: UTP--glucose-1-phosphate uridylyltransferase [Candidatus Magasanikbacteria bacterium RIFCSPHIGHO2_01_FULL_47_8]|uniref:UTP--glucose-1-phosphate uridylyltransferase n=1 Tax=Candidatus Magasanikbacteria bacterium RIFCSPHIGHO2_01_FULL_47_8 TaxID=1798673 RepID=A0A1F6MC46_9BACT|nr:MAG: UTP--glucose-1-phosphate uridylyltransferase [Candidatus Magasanikbacteria bacterium RIFCSPHIGHO2_01_FULL_47_8]